MLACFCLTGRVLELLVLLDEHWRKHRLGSYKLVLLHNTAFNTAEFAKSQVCNVIVVGMIIEFQLYLA